MVEIVHDVLKIEKEVEVSTTWGFPESIDPSTVLWLGDTDFALTLESDARTKKSVLCKAKQHKAVYTLGDSLDIACFNKIERFYPKPDYRDILVHESGKPKKKPISGNETSKSEHEESKSVTSSSSDNSKRKRNVSAVSISSPYNVSTISSISPHNSTLNTQPSQLPASPDLSHVTTYKDLELTDPSGAYLCGHCSRTFGTVSEMTNHCLEIHGLKKPFTCKICSKCFHNSRDLLLHTFVHTGEKNYKCFHCSVKFRQPKHRNGHMQKMHGDYFPYKCEHCGMPFQRRTSLTAHSREVHGPKKVMCSLCSAKFTTSAQLRDHICTRKERKMQCGACGEKFCRMADVLHHARFCRYVDPSDILCEKCGTVFPNAAKCSVHKTYLCTGELITPKLEPVETDSPAADSLVADSSVADSSVADSSVADSSVADSSVADSSVADSIITGSVQHHFISENLKKCAVGKTRLQGKAIIKQNTDLEESELLGTIETIINDQGIVVMDEELAISANEELLEFCEVSGETFSIL